MQESLWNFLHQDSSQQTTLGRLTDISGAYCLTKPMMKVLAISVVVVVVVVGVGVGVVIDVIVRHLKPFIILVNEKEKNESII